MGDLCVLTERLESVLTQPYDNDAFTKTCGAALSIIRSSPQEVLRLAHARLHAFPFKDVPECWRRLYSEASLWLAYMQLRAQTTKGLSSLVSKDQVITEVVRILDMAVIMTGAPGRVTLIISIMNELGDVLDASREPVAKRRRVNNQPESLTGGRDFVTAFPLMASEVCPPLRRPLEQAHNLSLPEFQDFLTISHTRNGCNGPLPIIVSASISTWPAMHPLAWNNPQYLLMKTLGGRRIVPIELGRSYTDEDWGQRLQTVREFMEANMFTSHVAAKQRGYLAQHDLFAQIPALKDDVLIPDYCYSDPPKRARGSRNQNYTNDESSNNRSGVNSDSEDDGNIMLNAWLGPAHTVSPAHTDPHQNILAQVVGHKYVRLFAPSQTSKMYPRGNENGVDMSNTSRVDIGRAMRLHEDWHGWDEFDGDDAADASLDVEFGKSFPDLASVDYFEGILASGDCLYIPEGWWHYVRSLSPSFSVSFWWD